MSDLRKPTVWLRPGVLIIYGASLDAAKHKHHAIQLVWPGLGARCQTATDDIAGPVVINSGIEHQLNMEAGWVVLVDPNSEAGARISDWLEVKQAQPIAELGLFDNGHPRKDDDPDLLLAPLLRILDLNSLLSGTANKVSDARIRKLLTRLDSCLPGECLQPRHWRARDVAQELALSESRFLHLFSEQMGIPWRPYLLWHRVICAVGALTQGASATGAAHCAGFSDSAHLSRTFKKLFGMTIRDAQALFPQ